MSTLEGVALCNDVGSFTFYINKKKYKAQYPEFFIWDYDNKEILFDLKKLNKIYKKLADYTKCNPYLIIRLRKIKDKIDLIASNEKIKRKEFNLYYYCKTQKENFLGRTFALDINEAIHKVIKDKKLDKEFNEKDFLIEGSPIFEKYKL